MILVTGATGFVGSHLVKELVKKGYKIRCFVKKDDTHSPTFNENFEMIKKLGVEIVYGDIRNKRDVFKAVNGVDKVVHLAALLGKEDPKLNYEINVRGSKNVRDACVKQKVKRVIAMGSIAGTRKVKGVYGKTKYLTEKLFLESPLELTILRPTLTYGRGAKGFSKIMGYVKKFPFFIPVIGSGKFKRQPVYIGDVISAIMLALNSKKTINKVYNLAGPETLSFNEFIDAICSELHIKKIKIHIPISICAAIAKLLEKFLENPPITMREVVSINQDTTADISLAKKEINFNPLNVKEGLRKALKEFKKNDTAKKESIMV